MHFFSFNDYLDMESTKTISSSVEKNGYKFLNVRSLHFTFLNVRSLHSYSGSHQYLEEAGYNFFDLRFIIYIYKELKITCKSPSSCKLHEMISLL